MSHWAVAPINRCQITLFAPTLDDSLVNEHPVRLFDEVLRGIDFGDWESMYVRVAGQPPIHPRIMAAGLLYGLSLGIRSSRKVEDACGNRLDFIWLMQGHKPDHATFCKFRTQFGPQLKALFGKIGRVGIAMGLITLNQVMLDGTDTRANNSRYKTGHRASMEQKLAALDGQIEQCLKQAEAQDKADDQLYGQETSPVKLPAELKDLKRRQQKLAEAMKKLNELDKAGSRRKSPRGPAVPLTDPDSRVLPNKTGGYAPNYTSVLGTDADSGMIVDVQVLANNNEACTVLPAVANIEEQFGAKPKTVGADTAFNNGPNLQALHEQKVEALMPTRQQFKENSAHREDVSQPVARNEWGKLPVNPQNKCLDKAAFIYDPEKDCYTCPMGKTLEYQQDKPYNRDGVKGSSRIYECGACAGCPLAKRCLPRNATERRVSRDEYEEYRENLTAKMKTEEAKAQYKRRSHVAETPFAVLKTRMNFRQFLLRGLKKVEMELRWTAIAYNLGKLVNFKAKTAALASLAAPSVVQMA
jgi:transposase